MQGRALGRCNQCANVVQPDLDDFCDLKRSNIGVSKCKTEEDDGRMLPLMLALIYRIPATMMPQIESKKTVHMPFQRTTPEQRAVEVVSASQQHLACCLSCCLRPSPHLCLNFKNHLNLYRDAHRQLLHSYR
jgi:hypothetical protein